MEGDVVMTGKIEPSGGVSLPKVPPSFDLYSWIHWSL